MIAAAGLALELAGAIEAGVDTVALVAKVHAMLDGCEDLLDGPWEPVRIPGRRRRPRKVVHEGLDLVA